MVHTRRMESIYLLNTPCPPLPPRQASRNHIEGEAQRYENEMRLLADRLAKTVRGGQGRAGDLLQGWVLDAVVTEPL